MSRNPLFLCPASYSVLQLLVHITNSIPGGSYIGLLGPLIVFGEVYLIPNCVPKAFSIAVVDIFESKPKLFVECFFIWSLATMRTEIVQKNRVLLEYVKRCEKKEVVRRKRKGSWKL